MARKGAVIIASGPWAPEPWAAALRSLDPDRPLTIWPDLPADPATVRFALAWRPPEGALLNFPNLAAIFSLGAGVDHIVVQAGLPDVPIVRVVSPRPHRADDRMGGPPGASPSSPPARATTACRPTTAGTRLPQPAAGDVRVGVMGLGVLGRDAADVLARLGFQVAGWSRRPAIDRRASPPSPAPTGSMRFSPAPTFSSRSCRSPRRRAAFSRCRSSENSRATARLGGPVVINAGRGGLQVEADIVAAIENGVLIGASLDVFEQEPLDRASRLWDLPSVVITPHTAASSYPEELTAIILDQIRAFEAGKPLENVIDRTAGY